jgi:hypothetical protein
MSFVRNAVQQCTGKVGIAKYLRPVPKTHIRGDDHRPLFMTLGKDLKQQFRPLLGKGNITQFIDDQ